VEKEEKPIGENEIPPLPTFAGGQPKSESGDSGPIVTDFPVSTTQLIWSFIPLDFEEKLESSDWKVRSHTIEQVEILLKAELNKPNSEF